MIPFLFALNGIYAQDLGKIGDSSGVKVTGGAGLRTIFYAADGGADRRQPFTYVLSGNANLNLYELNIPFSFTFSNQQFGLSQPFNEFGASPTYKWATAHVGYRNINLSQYTLAGHQMLGGGVELNPGKFRLTAIYGRLQRAVTEDTTLLALRRPAFERKGYGIKVGYGSPSKFIDFVLFKAADDENSLDAEETPETITPGENVVFGVNSRTAFFKDKLAFFFDGAVSTWVRDKRLEGEVLDLPGYLNWIDSFIGLNESAQYYTAFKSGLQLRLKNFGLQGIVQRIDSDYRSMGIYFVNNDVLAYTVAPSFSLFKGRLRVDGGLTLQRDNLNNKKAFTSKRTIPRASLFFRPSQKLSFIGTYTNVTTLMEEGAIPLDNEFKQDQNNPIYTFTATYATATTTKAHQVSLFANRSELVDNNLLTSAFSEYVGNTVNLSYNFNHLTAYYGLFASLNYNDLETFNGKLPGKGISLGFNKSWLEGKLTFNLSGSYAEQNDFGSQSVNFGGAYQLGKHQLNITGTYLNTQVIDGTFNEFTGFINYGIRF
ncbi:hypothetical protein ABV409_15315 [Flagellimonas sp. DF-77]|uniref:hypothetical protein n=1 Tax=Flagellimonas algarum TaxID=3230298 RepID=UPI0033991C1B